MLESAWANGVEGVWATYARKSPSRCVPLVSFSGICVRGQAWRASARQDRDALPLVSECGRARKTEHTASPQEPQELLPGDAECGTAYFGRLHRVRTFLTRDRPTRLRTALPLNRAYRSPSQRVNQSPFRVTCGCAAVSRSRRMNKSKFAQTIEDLFPSESSPADLFRSCARVRAPPV